MPQDLQNLMAQAEAAQRQMRFLGYSIYASIVVCAIFSVLIFWKLCQIQKQLVASSQSWPSTQSPPANPVASEAAPPPGTRFQFQDDSRFMPKK
jgi:hypothetical protein